MPRTTRFAVLLGTALIFAAAEHARGDDQDCEGGNQQAYAACMNGVNYYYNACMSSGGDPLDCEMNRLIAEIECWAEYCMILPDPGGE